MDIIRKKVYWVTVKDITLNKRLIHESLGLDLVVDRDLYRDFHKQTNMIGYYYCWNPFRNLINNKLKTYNFN